MGYWEIFSTITILDCGNRINLIQHKCADDLNGEALTPKTLTKSEKTKMIIKTSSFVILCSKINYWGKSWGKGLQRRCGPS